jgi:hypothetical protein
VSIEESGLKSPAYAALLEKEIERKELKGRKAPAVVT